MRIKGIFLLTCGLIVALVTTAQQDSLVSDLQETFTSPKSNKLKLKPRIGLGMGTYMFMGDIGSYEKGYHPGTAQMAFNIAISNEITSFLDMRLYSIFGTVTINEYSSDRSLNMRSQVRTGGMNLSYNFEHLISSRSNIQPYVTLGFESFEFLSKTDMYDANGQQYHYWSDGSIMNMAENDPNASNASALIRDHVYETDMRELNQDGFGKYAERNFAVPVGAGVQFLITDRFRGRVGTEMHYTLTDLVDNTTSESAGSRAGNDKNDRFLYSSVAVNYDLNITPKGGEPMPFEMFGDEDDPALAMIDMDSDNDGIHDFVDKCLGTPDGAPVDEFGCPVDADGDGFPDYRDEEAMSPHIAVDFEGIALSDEELAERYYMWSDSIPWKTGMWNEVYAKVDSDPSHWTNQYSIQVGAESEGLTQAEINAILSLKDVTALDQMGEQVYVVGMYEHLPEAVMRKLELQREGINGEVVKQDEGRLVSVGDEALAVEAELVAVLADCEVIGDGAAHFRVQVGAFRYELNDNIFAGINDIIALKGDDGLTRYMTKSYDSIEQAAVRKVELLLRGFVGAFISAYRDGQRIQLRDTSVRIKAGAEDLIVDKENSSIKAEKVNFTIQLGVFSEDIPTSTLDVYLSLGDIETNMNNEGNMSYYTGSFQTLLEAEQKLADIQMSGVPEAVIVGIFNSRIIPLEDAKNIKPEKLEAVMNNE
jgi:hypothetical protein